MYLVNFTRFHVPEENAPPVLTARRRWSADCRGNERFHGGLLVALDGHEWLDVAIWEQPTNARPAGRDALPDSEFVDRLRSPSVEILGLETGSLVFADQTALIAPASHERSQIPLRSPWRYL
jgi:hypothetical protein